jgi:hypothetical protein
MPRLFPPIPKPPLNVVRPVALGLLALALAAGVLTKLGLLFPGRAAGPERAGLSDFALEQEDRESPVQLGGVYRYILTRDQVVDLYETGLKLFADYRDEAAKLRLNRLIESNASEPVKNKARLLISYMEVPGFDTLKDRFSYADVRQDPLLYRGCHVIWQGMATNLNADETTTGFDFLVGYDTRSRLEGIVQVRFDSSVSLDVERPLEVLGRVIPVSTATGEEGIRLEGLALHQSSPPTR